MLTERIVRDTKPEAKPKVLWDGQIKGLGCKVFPSGNKAYVLSYRVGERKRLATLGRCSELSLRDARDRARNELAQIRRGAADPLERRQREREAPTVDDALRRFFDETVPQRIAAGRFAERTAREYRKHAVRYVGPALGTMLVSKVTRHNVESFAATLSDRPSQRNRVLAFVSRIFALAERWEWRPQHTNPVRGIERAREEPRRRILTGNEFASLSRVLREAEPKWAPSVAAIRVAALSGLRISEVARDALGRCRFRIRAGSSPPDQDRLTSARSACSGAQPGERSPPHQHVDIHVRALRSGDVPHGQASFLGDRLPRRVSRTCACTICAEHSSRWRPRPAKVPSSYRDCLGTRRCRWLRGTFRRPASRSAKRARKREGPSPR